MAGPSIDFWQSRFESGSTPWDRGAPSPQLQAWLKAGAIAAGDRVVVPGCGRGWEVATLAACGVKVTGVDYAPAAIRACRTLLDDKQLDADLVEADVLRWRPAVPADVVYEQTCLCALHPDHWQQYAAQVYSWLRPGGRLLALFVQALSDDAADGIVKGPPYHCDIHAMRALFPSDRWDWEKPPYQQIHQKTGVRELAVVLTRA
jgi:SAM-dependent methyltransferase